MKTKITWLVMSGWMVAALLLASCAPAVVEQEAEKVAPKEEAVVPKEVVTPKEVVVPEKEAEMVKWTGTKLDGTVVERMIEKPKYGGIYVTVKAEQPLSFDNSPHNSSQAWAINPIVNEQLFQVDWTRGPAGTQERLAHAESFAELGFETGILAEGWELPEPGTIVFHIRQGIHWGFDPNSEASRLVGGRGLTADDVASSMRRTWTPGNYVYRRTPFLIDPENKENSIYVSPTDKWAVVLKFKPVTAGGPVWQSASDHQFIIAPEVYEQYGDQQRWENVVGTGPFLLKDYVVASALTYVRNPNYWRHDPFFPENQLPYLDGFKVLIIPDMSTRQAALRTGKIDMLPFVTAEQAEPLLRSNPELKRFLGIPSRQPAIYIRMDKPESPWADIRVRRALMLAINQQEILDEFYGGKAVMSVHPVAPIPAFEAIYVPLEEMAESIRELWEYHPDKARQLLAEAGYPDGFKTEVITLAANVDLLSVVEAYWAEIGVDMEIAVREYGTHRTMGVRSTFGDMWMGELNSPIWPYTFTAHREGSGANFGNISDPKVEEAFQAINEVFFDLPKRQQVLRDFVPYLKGQVWFVELPAPNFYNLWWPWVKNFHGVYYTGHGDPMGHPMRLWIDQDLKKAMGY